MRRLRVAQVAPLYESVPPRAYGGTERVVSYLTEELVQLGHDVTLFASADSVTTARLVPCCRGALRLDESCQDPIAHHVAMIELVARHAHQFDVIHFHCDYLHFPVTRRLGVPNLTTLHGRLDLPELQGIYDCFADMPVVSISDAQRQPLPQARWLGTVYHGLPPTLLREGPGGGYLVFLGRVSPEKGLPEAIRIATEAEVPLRIAAKIAACERDYYEQAVRPLLGQPGVEFLGEVGDADGGRQRLLGEALALLLPIDWPEPFGLVMIEAMACGTPVIARNRGSVPEIVEHGVTGYVYEHHAEAVAAVRRIGALDRGRIRREFEERFVAARMAAEYETTYRRLVHGAWSEAA